ncbi:MAG: septum site-determining protein MinC [Cyanobium sp.]|nr:septum site-determining protein MinC [Cyanobacteriota bacterium]
MPAELIPSVLAHQPHLLKLPQWQKAGSLAAEVSDALLLCPDLRGRVTLLANEWPLRIGDFHQLIRLLEGFSLSLERVCCLDGGSRVAAAALGLDVATGWSEKEGEAQGGSVAQPFSIHQGTVRSGEHRHASGSLLVLGDVNPGAQISAEGHVFVWGKLRGIAHAGCSGDPTAWIVALHLHPLQLRIAEHVARGPEDTPPPGLAEKAHLVKGAIQIDPADPRWPLVSVPAKLSGLSAAGNG